MARESDYVVEEEDIWSDWMEGTKDGELQQAGSTPVGEDSQPTHGLSKWIEKSVETDLARLAASQKEEVSQTPSEADKPVASPQNWIPPTNVVPADSENNSVRGIGKALCSLPLDKSSGGSVIILVSVWFLLGCIWKTRIAETPGTPLPPS